MSAEPTWIPKGLEEPTRCNSNKWINARPAIAKGRIKCSAKKRVRVAEVTEKPPQIQITNASPIIGIEVIILVITVAPQ